MPPRPTAKILGAKLRKKYDALLSQRRGGKISRETYTAKTTALFNKQVAHNNAVAQRARERAEERQLEKEGIKLMKQLLAKEKREFKRIEKNTYLVTITADKNVRVMQTRGKNNKRLKNPKEVRSFVQPGAFTTSIKLTKNAGETAKAFKLRIEKATQEHITNLNNQMYDVAGGGGGEDSYVSYGNASTSVSQAGGGSTGMTRAKPYHYEYQAFASIVDDGNCVPESLAKLYPKIGLERIQNDLGGAGAKTCQQVLEWCQKYDITCIGCDDKFNVLVEYYSRNKNRSPLYFVEKDNHFYLMDKSRGISIANSRSNSHKQTKVKEDEEVDAESTTIVHIEDGAEVNYMAENTHYVVNNASEVKAYLFEYIEEYRSIPSVQFSALSRTTVFIKSFKFGKKSKMTINKNINLLNDLNTKLKSDAPSLKSIVDVLLKDTVLPTSFLNKITMKVFTEWKQRQHYAHLMSPKQWEEIPGIEQAWDANKQYTSALINMPCDWLVFDMFSLPAPYTGGVKDAYYYIETQNVMPCKGNGWYSRIILQWLIDNKEEFEVKYEIIGSTISKDTFKPFVKKAIELTPNFKYITNTLCGSLNTHSVNTAKGYISANKNDIVGRCMSSDAHLVRLSTEVFACASIQVQVKNNTNMPMYAQILDYASIMLADTIKHLKSKGCIIRGYNTDSVTFKYPEVLPIDISTEKIGGWKTEEPKPYEYKIDPVCNTKVYEFEEPKWLTEMTEDDFTDADQRLPVADAIVEHIISKNESLSLDGQAGFGKSYLLEKLIKKVQPENCVVLGYTNISANNVGGKTFHNTFKIDCITGLEKFDAKMVLKDKKWLIIDEKSQVPSELYRICQTAEEMGIPIIMAGDFAQILPVSNDGGKFDELRNSNGNTKADRFIKIVCKNLITLTKYKRGDTELLKRLTDVRNRIRIAGFDEVEKGRLHFCFTKRQRDIINNREMNKVKSGFMNMPKNSHIPKVYRDMPLRACETKQNGDWLNNERWTVIDMFNDAIQISNKEKTMNVPIPIFIQNFVPGYAMTIHSSQGLTITEPYTVWIEKFHAFKDDDVWRLIYTALSRATTKDQIGIIRQ
jgi:hypothetical protein